MPENDIFESFGGRSLNLPTRNNNPLNLKYGPLTKKFVEDGVAEVADKAQDGGSFLRFPTPEVGMAAAQDLLFNHFYQNMDVNSAMKTWSNNGYGAKDILPDDASTLLKDLPSEKKAMLVAAMAKREGFSPSSAPDAAPAQERSDPFAAFGGRSVQPQPAQYDLASRQGASKAAFDANQPSLLGGFLDEAKKNAAWLGNTLLSTAPGAATGMDMPGMGLFAAGAPGGAATEGMGLLKAAAQSPAANIVRALGNAVTSPDALMLRAAENLATVQPYGGGVEDVITPLVPKAGMVRALAKPYRAIAAPVQEMMAKFLAAWDEAPNEAAGLLKSLKGYQGNVSDISSPPAGVPIDNSNVQQMAEALAKEENFQNTPRLDMRAPAGPSQEVDSPAIQQMREVIAGESNPRWDMRQPASPSQEIDSPVIQQIRDALSGQNTPQLDMRSPAGPSRELDSPMIEQMRSALAGDHTPQWDMRAPASPSREIESPAIQQLGSALRAEKVSPELQAQMEQAWANRGNEVGSPAIPPSPQEPINADYQPPPDTGLPEMSPKMGAPDINRWMNVVQKQMVHGNNPGQQILEDGLLGADKASTLANVRKKLDGVDAAMQTKLEDATKAGIRIHAERSIMEPLEDATKTFGKRSDEAFNKQLENIKNDIAFKYPDLSNLTPLQFHDLTRDVGDAIKWGRGAAYENDVNQALLNVYKRLSKQLKTSVDGIADLQKQWGNLYQGVKSLKVSLIKDQMGRGTGPLPVVKSVVRR